MDAAQQLFGHAADAIEHIGHCLDVPRLAGVTGAEEGDLRHRKSKALDTSAGNERQRLQWLERAAGGGQELGIAGGKKQPALGVDHRHRPVVHAFGRIAAADNRKRRVGWPER